ncbi:MAG: hypothetical protein IPN29_10815 [Saprospiraceae bacterium]|nr:hypothetical protein [Saprospiraceae bacterium]
MGYSDEENNNNSIGLIISGLGHIAILFLFMFLTFSHLEPPPGMKAILVEFQAEDLNVSPSSKVESAPPAKSKTETPATSASRSVYSIKEKSPVVSKTTVDIEPVKAVPNIGKSTVEENEARLADKKQKFGSLFGKGSASTDKPSEGESSALDGISKGRGTIGGGLSGRGVVEVPTISESSQKVGIIVIKVCADRSGKVISARYTQKGSTSSDAQLVRIAEKGASRYLFSKGDLDSQCGTITFDFKLN